GVDVKVAVPYSHDPSGYTTASGTSYAAALVSGALAWIWTRRPDLDSTQLITLVRRLGEAARAGRRQQCDRLRRARRAGGALGARSAPRPVRAERRHQARAAGRPLRARLVAPH